MRPWIRLSSMALMSPALIVGCARQATVKTVSSPRTSNYPAYAGTTYYSDETPAVASTDESPAYSSTETTTYVKPSHRAKSRRSERNNTTNEPSDTQRQSVLTGSREEPARQSAYGITIEEFRSQFKDRSALIVDARSSDQYALGHIRGAINIPAGLKDNLRDRYLQNASPDQAIIVYCSSASCNSSDMLAEKLMAEGFTNVRVFTPGWQVLSHQRDLR